RLDAGTPHRSVEMTRLGPQPGEAAGAATGHQDTFGRPRQPSAGGRGTRGAAGQLLEDRAPDLAGGCGRKAEGGPGEGGLDELGAGPAPAPDRGRGALGEGGPPEGGRAR